jgi:hypothetical protein
MKCARSTGGECLGNRRSRLDEAEIQIGLRPAGWGDKKFTPYSPGPAAPEFASSVDKFDSNRCRAAQEGVAPCVLLRGLGENLLVYSLVSSVPCT